jgi:hypothetical protein
MKRAGILAVAATLLIAATVGSAAGAAPVKVYYDAPFKPHVYKPKRIEFHDATLSKLHWRHWNRKVAWGRGRARINTCDPFCAAGKIVHGRVHLKMYERHDVNGTRMYGCMAGTARADGKKYPIEWPAACKSAG